MKEIWRIITCTKQLRKYYAVISVSTILLAIVTQLQPIFTKIAIDEITKAQGGGHVDIALVAWMATAIFLTDLGQNLISNYGGYWGDMMSARLQKLLSERYYEHLLSLPQKYFDQELSGKIINRMNRGITQISTFMQMLSNNFLQFLFSTIFSLAVVAYFSWQVALMLFMLYPVFVYLTTRSSSKWQAYQATINQEQDIASGRFAESIGQVRVVKSFLQETRELSFLKNRFSTVVKTTKPQSRYWHTQDVKRRLVLNLIFFAVFAYIFIEAAHGRYSIGTAVLLIQYAMLIRIPIFTISFLVDSTQRAMSNTRDYFEAMDEQPEPLTHGHPSLAVTKGEIVFDDVTFGYDEKPVLQGISFTAQANTKIALVGESGQGKTTLANLVLRLYDVQDGQIRIDGQNIAEVQQKSLRHNIGVVFQDPALFSGTIRDNIAYANPGADQKDIEKAAKAANAHEFISKLEKGYDTEIGERGLKLSGGQKQRIAIARAILKDAPILILDEATSSLDSRSEHMVQEALERLMKDRTTLIIAHRLSTIQHVDQIVTLVNGKVAEIGTPQELAQTEGVYAQLLKLQGSKTEATKRKLKAFDLAA